MSPEAYKARARTWFQDVFSDGKLDAIPTLIAPNYVNHDPNVPGGMWRGVEGATALVSTYRSAFPDVKFTILDQIAEDDRVVTRWKAEGTNTGSLNGMPPTEKPVSITGTNIKRFAADGKVVEEWANFNMLGLLQQIGILPAFAG